MIFVAGEKPISVGIVLSGSVRVLQEDFWGNRTILAHIESSGLFGEAFSCAEQVALPVSVIACEATEIMLIDYRKIVTSRCCICKFYIVETANIFEFSVIDYF